MFDNECNVPDSTLYACGTGYGYQSYVTDYPPSLNRTDHECMNTK